MPAMKPAKPRKISKMTLNNSHEGAMTGKAEEDDVHDDGDAEHVAATTAMPNTYDTKTMITLMVNMSALMTMVKMTVAARWSI